MNHCVISGGSKGGALDQNEARRAAKCFSGSAADSDAGTYRSRLRIRLLRDDS